MVLKENTLKMSIFNKNHWTSPKNKEFLKKKVKTLFFVIVDCNNKNCKKLCITPFSKGLQKRYIVIVDKIHCGRRHDPYKKIV